MSAAITIEDLQSNAEQVLRNVVESEETALVTLPDGRAVAIVPDVDFQICDETAYLNSTPENRAALAESLKQAEEGKTVQVEL